MTRRGALDSVTRSLAPSTVRKVSGIAELLADCRRELDRVAPCDLAAEIAAGALVVDTRPLDLRERDGELPDAVAIDRNVLGCRLDRAARAGFPRPSLPTCESSWSATRDNEG